jgi:hypothetical protein
MSEPKKDAISAAHYISLDQVAAAQNALSLYGKVIRDNSANASSFGLSHPHGVSEPLHASLVYGVLDSGRCITLNRPQQVMLPTPDGPADGCGWDPDQYVVWKNLPRTWITTHIQTRSKALLSALFDSDDNLGVLSTRVTSSVATDFGTQVRIILQQWANLAAQPAESATLQELWRNIGGPFPTGAQDLAGRLNSQLGSKLQAIDLPPTMTVFQLTQMLLGI